MAAERPVVHPEAGGLEGFPTNYFNDGKSKRKRAEVKF